MCGMWKSGRNPHQDPRPTSRINRQLNVTLRKISENLGPHVRNSYKTLKPTVIGRTWGRRPTPKIRLRNKRKILHDDA